LPADESLTLPPGAPFGWNVSPSAFPASAARCGNRLVLPPCEHLRCTTTKSEVGEYPACPTSSWFDVLTPTRQYQLASTATLGNSALSRTAQRLTVPSAVKDTSGRLRTPGFGLPPMPLVGADLRPQMIHIAHRRGTSRPKMKMPQHSVLPNLWFGRAPAALRGGGTA
jgi:hypothetical protein